jgi:hypothetical protein
MSSNQAEGAKRLLEKASEFKASRNHKHWGDLADRLAKSAHMRDAWKIIDAKKIDALHLFSLVLNALRLAVDEVNRPQKNDEKERIKGLSDQINHLLRTVKALPIQLPKLAATSKHVSLGGEDVKNQYGQAFHTEKLHMVATWREPSHQPILAANRPVMSLEATLDLYLKELEQYEKYLVPRALDRNIGTTEEKTSRAFVRFLEYYFERELGQLSKKDRLLVIEAINAEVFQED